GTVAAGADSQPYGGRESATLHADFSWGSDDFSAAAHQSDFCCHHRTDSCHGAVFDAPETACPGQDCFATYRSALIHCDADPSIKGDLMKSLKFAGAIGAALVVSMLGTAPAHAQYPERQITMVVPFGAGGSTDIVGRITAQALSQRLNVPVVVDNRGGAGGTVGTQAAAGMPGDGYVITVATTSTHVVGPLTTKVRYNPVNDFKHIGMIAETPYVMVISPKLNAKSVQEVIDYAK